MKNSNAKQKARAADGAAELGLAPPSDATHNLDNLVGNLDAELAQRNPLTEQLWIAAQCGSATRIAPLLAQGADPLAKNIAGCDALMFAVSAGAVECAAALLDASNLDARTHFGETALMVAASSARPECISLLLPGSNLALKDRAGKTALILAVCSFSLPCVELLLPVSDPNERDHEGRTAFMIVLSRAAKTFGNLGLISRLLPVSDLDLSDLHGNHVDDLANRIADAEGVLIRQMIAAERERRVLNAEISPPPPLGAPDAALGQAGADSHSSTEPGESGEPADVRWQSTARCAPRL